MISSVISWQQFDLGKWQGISVRIREQFHLTGGGILFASIEKIEDVLSHEEFWDIICYSKEGTERERLGINISLNDVKKAAVERVKKLLTQKIKRLKSDTIMLENFQNAMSNL